MLVRPALKAPTYTSSFLGLQSAGVRTFTTSRSLLLRRISNTFTSPQSQTRTAAIPLRRHPLILTTLTASAISIPYLTSPKIKHDASPSSDFSTSGYAHGKDAKVPVSKDGGRSLNPAAVRQISLGSLLGLGAGVVVAAFSKMLVLLIGVGIVVSQYAARRGFNIIPVDKVQRYVKGVNLRSAINDNAAFKISFGLMFALTAFGEF